MLKKLIFILIIGVLLPVFFVFAADRNICCEINYTVDMYGNAIAPQCKVDTKSCSAVCDELNVSMPDTPARCTEVVCGTGVCSGIRGLDELAPKPVAPPDPIKIKLGVPIPGLEEFSQGDGVEVTNETIAVYIGGLYKFLIGLAGILAVIIIAYGGIVWTFSGGEASKITKAKELILGAIVGLVLALGSYLILYTINPKLVQFKGLPLPPVTKVVFVSEDVKVNACSSDSQVMKIPTYPKVSVSASNPRLLLATINKLTYATSLLKSGVTLKITSAYRDGALQAQLYNCYQTAKEAKMTPGQCPAGCTSCALAAEPKCSAPHQTGQAIDVCIIGGPNGVDTCSYIARTDCNDGACLQGAAKTNLADDQRYLQNLMKNAGFSRICAEWWHFESTAVSTSLCDPGIYKFGASGD